MSIIENLRGRSPAKPAPAANATIPKAPDVAKRLAGAEAELSQLESDYGSVALDALADTAGASDRLQDLQRRIATSRDRVATLKAAHKAAVGRDEEAIAAARAALVKTQLNALRKHLEARDHAAVALSAAIEETAKQFHALIDRSAKAQAACPIGMSWPGGSDCDATTIRRYVEAEFYRLSATAGNQDGRSLPGSQYPHTQFEWNPPAIPPIADRIKKASAYVIGKLTGKAPG